jgi:hypothetical protein
MGLNQSPYQSALSRKSAAVSIKRCEVSSTHRATMIFELRIFRIFQLLELDA